MDPVNVATAVTTGASVLSGISSAIGIIKSIRSSGLSEVPIATFLQLGDQLIDAQIAILALQKEILEKTEELRKLRESISEKEKYSLVETVPGSGNFAYARNVSPVESHSRTPVMTEPFHYICQSCFDKGIKSVLQRQFRGSVGNRFPVLYCHGCRTEILGK